MDKLNKLFNLPEPEDKKPTLSELMSQSKELESLIKRDLADEELDGLAKKAEETFDQLVDLGMNTEPRFSAPIFEAASKMLGHALTAKLGKIQKQLKQVDQKIKQNQVRDPRDNTINVESQVFDRNKLIQSFKESK